MAPPRLLAEAVVFGAAVEIPAASEVTSLAVGGAWFRKHHSGTYAYDFVCTYLYISQNT